MAVRWSLSHPLSATSVMELLAERGVEVSKRTLLRWVQTFGPLLAAEVRKHRRPLGTKCYVDEVFLFRREKKRYLYRAVDELGQVVDVLFREHRDTESALAFFRQALVRTGWRPTQVISDHHQPYVKAVQEVLPEAELWEGKTLSTWHSRARPAARRCTRGPSRLADRRSRRDTSAAM